jgi:hypothetical protein
MKAPARADGRATAETHTDARLPLPLGKIKTFAAVKVIYQNSGQLELTTKTMRRDASVEERHTLIYVIFGFLFWRHSTAAGRLDCRTGERP